MESNILIAPLIIGLGREIERKPPMSWSLSEYPEKKISEISQNDLRG